MKILFVLSQTEVTGAETYATTLADALRGLGHELLFVSDTLRDPSGFEFLPLPIHARNASYAGRVRNGWALRKILRDRNIDLVHSHSRAANLVAEFARLGLRGPGGGRIPMVVTVHGRWRNHFAARRLPCLGERTLAVCPALERYLVEDLRVPSAQVRTVPNGIDARLFVPDGGPADPNEFLYVGRFSGQKGNVIRFLLAKVFPGVAREHPDLRLSVVGGRRAAPELRDLVEVFNLGRGTEVVRVLEPEGSLLGLYRRAAAVIGSGRVALEAMACGKPVIAIGESSAPGLVTERNFQNAFDSNFGDCGEWNLFEKENAVAAEVRLLLADPKLAQAAGAWGPRAVRERFDAQVVARAVEQTYREALEELKR